VGEMKKNIDIEELTKDLPKEFAEYFEYLNKLHFKDPPNY